MSDNICEDLVVEIFTRLPPKSLIRFRSVSKSLCARIATPDFIRLHTILSNRIPERVLLRHEIPHRVGGDIFKEIFYTLHSENELPLSPDHGYDGITPFKFPFPLRSRAYAVGSCNGIMLVIDNGDLILWNPLIRRKLKLPSHPLRRAFSTVTGFAFDRVTEDYKIATLSLKYEQNNDTCAFVYTMKTRTWCQISNPVTPSTYETRNGHLVNLFETTKGHLVNGVLHWVVRITNQSRGANIHRYILTFDVSTHVFGMIELPRHENCVKLTTINGSLAVITYEGDYAKIWVRKENNTTPNWVAYLSVRVNYYASVMPLSRNGYFLLKNLPVGIELCCDLTTVRSPLVEFSDSSIIKNMSWFVESLELLDTGSPYEESKP